jgi:hypothetical protein
MLEKRLEKPFVNLTKEILFGQASELWKIREKSKAFFLITQKPEKSPLIEFFFMII